MLNLSLQQNRSVEPRRRRLNARRESIKKELERLSNMEQIERATSKLDTSSLGVLSRSSLDPESSRPRLHTAGKAKPTSKQKTTYLLAEDRPNCRLRNNGISPDAGHALVGTRLGSGNNTWFRPGLAPDEHSPPPALARSARSGTLAIVERRNCRAPGHVMRTRITKQVDLMSPSLGLSSRKKEMRERLAAQRQRKAPRLRSLQRTSPA